MQILGDSHWGVFFNNLLFVDGIIFEDEFTIVDDVDGVDSVDKDCIGFFICVSKSV